MPVLVKPDQDRDLERFRSMEHRLVRCLIIAFQIDPNGTSLCTQPKGVQSVGIANNQLWLQNWVRPRLEAWQVRQASTLLNELIIELETVNKKGGETGE